jgi:hypothetical protein
LRALTALSYNSERTDGKSLIHHCSAIYRHPKIDALLNRFCRAVAMRFGVRLISVHNGFVALEQ